MFIFERLLSKDLEKVYYVIHNEQKKVFNFYTQDYETIQRIITSDDWERAFFEVYITLYKVRRENCKDELLNNKIPALSKCVNLNCDRIRQERERRKTEGLKTQLRLKD